MTVHALPSHHFDIIVLDTNVLLLDAHSLLRFDAHCIIIPIEVVKELEELKEAGSLVGKQARTALTVLESLHAQAKLHYAVPDKNQQDVPPLAITTPERIGYSPTTVDNALINTCLYFIKKGFNTALCSQDMHLRLQATHKGIHTLAYARREEVTAETLAPVYKCFLPPKQLKLLTKGKVCEVIPPDASLIRNQFVRIMSESNSEVYRIFRYQGGSIYQEVSQDPILGVFEAKNPEQAMALDLLFDDDIKLVSLFGKAGCGKTFLTLLAALYKVLLDRAYRKIMITRPTISVGSDIGFLPGDVEEKLENWMLPIFDNISVITHTIRSNKVPVYCPTIDQMREDRLLVLQAITYIRGRSLPYQFLFIDEAQNLTLHEVKTLITRAGNGTKVIMTGDPDQIDTPRLTKQTNGLVIATQRFLGDPLFGAVHLEKSERSLLAQRAAELL